jgi:type II secretory pathway pseudopilin PulG
MLIAVVIISILVGISFQALRNSRAEADKNVAANDARVLNDAIRRVEISGEPGHWSSLSNIIHVQQDGDAAIMWLVTNSYINL